MQFYTSLFRHPLLASSPGSSPQPSHARARAMLVLAWDSPVCPPFRPFIVHKLKYREEDLLYSRARARYALSLRMYTRTYAVLDPGRLSFLPS